LRSASGDAYQNNNALSEDNLASDTDSASGVGFNGRDSLLSRAWPSSSRQQIAFASSARPVSSSASAAAIGAPALLGGREETAPASFIDSLGLSEKQLADLNGVGMTFFYLRPRRGGDGSAYDLEVVSQDGIDKDGYFTLSKEGMTFHSARESSFTSLRQWEREYKLFHRMSRIRFFMQYRRWKVSPQRATFTNHSHIPAK
jgi:hypothetical protein